MTFSSPVHLLVADDHPLYLQALCNTLRTQLSEALIETAENYLALFEILSDNGDAIDLLVIDLFMPGSTGYGGLYFLHRHFPELPIVVVSAHDDLSVRNKCLENGAAAFVSKSEKPELLLDAVMRILGGNYSFQKNPGKTRDTPEHYERLASLTNSQFKVLHLIASGLSNKQIADRLAIAEKTVKAHVSAIFTKLNVKNRTQAALMLSDEAR